MKKVLNKIYYNIPFNNNNHNDYELKIDFKKLKKKIKNKDFNNIQNSSFGKFLYLKS